MRTRKRTTARSNRLEGPPELVAPSLVTIPPATPVFGVPVTVGSVDSGDWLRHRGIRVDTQHWFVEVVLGAGDAPLVEEFGDRESRFHIYIYPQEWGFLFCHASQTSWIRIADRPYVHGRDDYGLVANTPPLRELSLFVRELEARHQVAFRRDRVLVRTNLDAIDDRVRSWAATL